MRARLEAALRRLGPAGIVALGILVACAAFYTEALRPAEEDAAARRGLDPSQLATELIVEGLSKAVAAKPLDALSKWEALNETDDPAEIARRQKEFEEFKEGMNRNRLEMEGPLSRKVYP